MKLGVVGYGVVGKATAQAFRQKGQHKVLVNDTRDITPENNHSLKTLAESCEAIFLCVPTPLKNPLSHITDVVHQLANYSPKLIVFKSTVPPTTTEHFSKQYPHLHFACNPEFLRQDCANEDAITPDRIVLGAFNQADSYTLQYIYEAWTCPKILCYPTTAELIKYASNMYLVNKVAYALEIARLCKALGAEPSKVMRGVGLDKRITPSHLNPALGKIPMHSPCLAKDMHTFLKFLESTGEKSELLLDIWKNGVENNEQK